MADAQLRILGGEALKENLFLRCLADAVWVLQARSEEHTSELQSQSNLVCRLLLEKKKRHLNHKRRQGPRAGHQLPPAPPRLTDAFAVRNQPDLIFAFVAALPSAEG